MLASHVLNFVPLLFTGKNHTMEWEVRLKVAYSIAEALDCCSSAGFASYNNLSAYSILFDEVYIIDSSQKHFPSYACLWSRDAGPPF